MEESVAASSSPASSPPGDPPTVAVIVVHGVADQEPHDSARAIASLLSSQNSPTRLKYATFTEESLRIEVDRIEGADDRPEAADGRLEGADEKRPTFYTRAKAVARASAASAAEASSAQDACASDPGIVMMHTQLQGYEPGEHAVYGTVCLRSERDVDGARAGVHVYELYWADLSRLSQGWFRFLGEMYQLLLHVPSLGRHAVDAGGIDDGRDNPAWQRLIEQQRWASYLLTVPIPLLNLWLFGTLLVGVTGALVIYPLPPIARPLPSVLLLGLSALGGLSLALSTRAMSFRAWAAVPLVILAASVALYWAMWRWSLSFQITAYVAVAVLFAAGWWLVNQYTRTRPDCRTFGRASLTIVVVALAGSLIGVEDNEHSVVTAAFHIGECVYLAASLSWAALFVLQWMTFWTDWRALRYAVAEEARASTPRPGRVERLRRAARTARLALAIPTVSFIVITMVLWAASYHVLERLVNTKGYTPWLLQHFVAPAERDKLTAHAYAAWKLIVISAPELVVLLSLAGIAILLALWATLPVVVSEVRVPRETVDPRNLGRWLNRGLSLLHGAGTLIILASSLVLPVVIVHLVAASPLMAWLGDWLAAQGVPRQWIARVASTTADLAGSSEGLLKMTGTLVAGTAVGLFALGGRLKTLTGGARPALDVLLDVDNYLREHPQTNNPRARIFARYIALLRHICRWRDAQGRPYQGLVIIAHSQGSVITADLLRYLACHHQTSLEALHTTLRTWLLTMGSPLRQLYGLRFPHFYRWSYHDDLAAASTGDDPPFSAPDIPPTRVPDPTGFNIAAWTNLYRSADYIGRHLWRLDQSPYVALLPGPASATPRLYVSIDDTGRRREYCVGAGAHTHYWDGSAPLVAEALDEAIGASLETGTATAAADPGRVRARPRH